MSGTAMLDPASAARGHRARSAPPPRRAVSRVDPLAPAPGTVIHRCACGGTCPACRARALAAEARDAVASAAAGPYAVSTPADPLEHEADQMAARVMAMGEAGLPAGAPRRSAAAPMVMRQAATLPPEEEAPTPAATGGDAVEEHPVLHLKSDGGGAPAPSAGGRVGDVLRGGGAPLAPGLRSFFEPRFGVSLGSVRVHTGAAAAASARALHARAYAVGGNVVFAEGEYAPSSRDGMWLLAHELAHVVQQGAGTAPAGRVQRMARGVAGGSPRANFIEVPAAEQGEVDRAIGLVRRVAESPANFPACHQFFRDNCPGGTLRTFREVFDRAVVWRRTSSAGGILGTTHDNSEHISYTDLAFRWGRWAVAATLVHELIHSCGQNDHDIGDRAKDRCGRLPDI